MINFWQKTRANVFLAIYYLPFPINRIYHLHYIPFALTVKGSSKGGSCFTCPYHFLICVCFPSDGVERRDIIDFLAAICYSRFFKAWAEKQRLNATSVFLIRKYRQQTWSRFFFNSKRANFFIFRKQIFYLRKRFLFFEFSSCFMSDLMVFRSQCGAGVEPDSNPWLLVHSLPYGHQYGNYFSNS